MYDFFLIVYLLKVHKCKFHLQGGKARQYALGKWLRNRYKDFIDKKWIAEEVYIRSTDVDRTLMSALCNLASFYYPDAPDRFEKNLAWSPTPIHTAPLTDDKVIFFFPQCGVQ